MRIKNNGKIEHKCKAYRGKIKDVSIRFDKVMCRACGQELSEEEIDPEILAEIKPKIDERKRRKQKSN